VGLQIPYLFQPLVGTHKLRQKDLLNFQCDKGPNGQKQNPKTDLCNYELTELQIRQAYTIPCFFADRRQDPIFNPKVSGNVVEPKLFLSAPAPAPAPRSSKAELRLRLRIVS
jgi:hypothetical protein